MSALQVKVDNLRKAGYYVTWTYYPTTALYHVVVAKDMYRVDDFVSVSSVCDWGGEFTIMATITKLHQKLEEMMNV